MRFAIIARRPESRVVETIMQAQSPTPEPLANLPNRGDEILMRTRELHRDLEMKIRRLLEMLQESYPMRQSLKADAS
jgi:hypothetical protein